jgi:hypothetical protein
VYYKLYIFLYSDYWFIAAISDVIMDGPEEEITERSKSFYSYCGKLCDYILQLKQTRYILEYGTKIISSNLFCELH